jgi:hypothetical protein
MPPEMITKVIPRATMPLMEVCRPRLERLRTVRKVGLAKERKMKSAARISSSDPSEALWARRNRRRALGGRIAVVAGVAVWFMGLPSP